MSSVKDRGRSRSPACRREGEDQRTAAETAQTPHAATYSATHTASASTEANQIEPAAASGPEQLQAPSAEVQPLPEQFRKRPRPSCLLDLLATVELQLVMQWLDTKSKLKTVRCSRRLLQAASQPIAWKDSPPFFVEARTA